MSGYKVDWQSQQVLLSENCVTKVVLCLASKAYVYQSYES